jgi:protein-S-isoprenylcysteine O-methyltransferase Ste14
MIDQTKNAQFHWAEGNKFALEFFKSLFLLSGTLSAALIGLLATNKDSGAYLFWPITILLAGACLSILALIICYFINLNYGNAELDPKKRQIATRAHTFMYFYSVAVLIVFGYGMFELAQAAKHYSGQSASLKWSIQLKAGN